MILNLSLLSKQNKLIKLIKRISCMRKENWIIFRHLSNLELSLFTKIKWCTPQIMERFFWRFKIQIFATATRWRILVKPFNFLQTGNRLLLGVWMTVFWYLMLHLKRDLILWQHCQDIKVMLMILISIYKETIWDLPLLTESLGIGIYRHLNK